MNLHKQILLSRLLTRSGDQAWDFALPVTLVLLFPTSFGLIAALFFATKVGQFLFQPMLAGVIDRWKRSHTAYFGTLLQLVSVTSAAACLFALAALQRDTSTLNLSTLEFLLIVGITIASVGSTLGSGLMDIAIGNDWIPTLVAPEELAQVNSRLKQIDLATEVLSPVIAGLLLGISASTFPLLGFSLIVTWNVASFFPEMMLLRNVFRSSKSLHSIVTLQTKGSQSLLRKTFNGWKEFWRHPSAAVMVAYAFLWLSALSPHGVLLTSFLKGGWQLSEFTLGLFRGSGALFGLLATLMFPPIVKRFGLHRGSLLFILLQALALILALPFFYFRSLDGLVFLVLLLVSRIGLYGFSMGEMEIRQRTIGAGQRGLINGVASALTGFATLTLYGAGTLVGGHEQFSWMVVLSVSSVCVGALVYLQWFQRNSRDSH